MPKLKTKKALAKRFKFSKKGKVKRSKAFKGHLLGKKSQQRKRALRRTALVAGQKEMAKIKKLLPYG